MCRTTMAGRGVFFPRRRPTPARETRRALVRLADGRLCLTYGYRAQPFSIQARLSSDQGKTWTDPIMLRGNGGSQDIGYPRSIVRSDGNVVTVYAFHDRASSLRDIEATIWNPGGQMNDQGRTSHEHQQRERSGRARTGFSQFTLEIGNNNGQRIVLTSFAPAAVPEPSSLILAGIASLAGLVTIFQTRRSPVATRFVAAGHAANR